MLQSTEHPRRDDVLRELFELGILDEEELERELASGEDEEQRSEPAAA